MLLPSYLLAYWQSRCWGSPNALLETHTVTASFVSLLSKRRHKMQKHAEEISPRAFSLLWHWKHFEIYNRRTESYHRMCCKTLRGGMQNERNKQQNRREKHLYSPWILISHSQHTHLMRKEAEKIIKPCFEGTRKEQTYLWNEELASCKLPLAGVHFPVGIYLGTLQLLAAVHQRFHLRLHLADVKPCHGELLFNHPVHIC